MRIAILGWGSLIWDERKEFDQTHGEWAPDGPSLKLEFSRVSQSRDGALTLVIDERNGDECEVSYALSTRSNIEDAVCDLKCREGTVLKRIGCILANDRRLDRPKAPDTITNWMYEKKTRWSDLDWSQEQFSKRNQEGILHSQRCRISAGPPSGRKSKGRRIYLARSKFRIHAATQSTRSETLVRTVANADLRAS